MAMQNVRINEAGSPVARRKRPCVSSGAEETKESEDDPLILELCLEQTNLTRHDFYDIKKMGDELAPGSKAGPPLEHTISAEKLTTTYKLPFKFNEKNGMMKVYKNGKWKHCCQYCPKTANYPDENGNLRRLCAAHAREVGSYEVHNPCQKCPPGKKVQANYPDENGNICLCATHATEVGSHEVQNPCQKCPPGKKVQANYPDENGNICLCATHATEVGSHKVLNPCQKCPPGKKIQAAYPDENGNICLCATHAREVGSYEVHNPCQKCPPGKKIQAHYPDENGNICLCATHARDVGSYEVHNPCQKCPPGKKVQANYPDENGNICLCARHAVLAGTHVESKSGGSVIACKCFDRWERLTGERIGHRIRYIAAIGGSRAEGREITGLIPNSKLQPDGYQEETKTVWLFHGNYFHGYPPDHPKHETRGIGGKWGPDLYKKIMEDMALYARRGYTVRYVWEHEYSETTRAKCPVSLRNVVHTLKDEEA